MEVERQHVCFTFCYCGCAVRIVCAIFITKRSSPKEMLYILSSLFGCGKTLRHYNPFDRIVCPPCLFAFLPSLIFCIWMHILSLPDFFFALSLSLSSFKSQWSLRYDLDHNTISTNNCFDFELFFFLILSLWPILLLLKVTIQFFSHSVSHVSFEFHTQSHCVNSKVNEEL